MTSAEHWEKQADSWTAFARAGNDAYWHESGPPFPDLLPSPPGAVLDLGCGEGRVTRDLRARGYQVVAVDAAPTLVRLAREADANGDYRVADATSLPFEEASFDLVVAFNSLMDVHDMPGAVREAARVLVGGGRLCACITHPIRDAGRFESRDPNAAFVISGSYLAERPFGPLTVARNGFEVTFAGWAYPLSSYARALEDAGLLIERMREPPDPNRSVPNFLLIRAVKP